MSEKTIANESSTKKEDGLPDIANTQQQKNMWMAAIFGALAIFVILFAAVLHNKSKTKSDAATDETFSIQSSAPSLGNLQLSPQQVAKLKALAQNNALPPAASMPPPAPTDAQKALVDRIRAPIMVVGGNASGASATDAAKANATTDPNMQFLNQTANDDVEVSHATILKHRDQLISQGTIIDAVLESEMNTDLPGFIRAEVSNPVYSDDGSQLLIPPGSSLIGQYRNSVATGQKQIFIVWTRLKEPNGVSIPLGSPGVEALGTTGFTADQVDHHFWQMFGTAALLSVIGAGASNVDVNTSDQYNAAQAYRQGVSQSFAQSANNALQQNGNIPPTLHKRHGNSIKVFVARDLYFGNKTSPSINVF